VRLAILGPGGVGGFLAGALDRAGTPVTLIAREPTAGHLREHGLRVSSTRLGAAWTARPAITEALEEPVDVLIVATKAIGLDAALDRVRVAPGLVLPLLNGLDHLVVLRERFPAVAAAVIRVEATRTAPGVIEQTSPFLGIGVATEGPQAPAIDDRLAPLLEAAGIPVRVGGTEAEVLWGKLVRLNAIALATAASGTPMGQILGDAEQRAALEAAVREGAAVAVAEGAPLDAEATWAEVVAVHPGLVSSMARDVEAGREPELDAIAGAVLRAAARHDVPVPAVIALTRRVADRAGVAAPVA
jgi:2-dehydropantoate 2-reductase